MFETIFITDKAFIGFVFRIAQFTAFLKTVFKKNVWLEDRLHFERNSGIGTLHMLKDFLFLIQWLMLNVY